jgi:ABC-type transport system substrate-binding protein
MKKVSFIILAVLLVSSLLPGLLLSACGEPTSTATTPAAGTPKHGGTLTVSEPIFPGQPLGYPPERGFAEVLFQQPCLEPLLEESIAGVFSARLATDWEVAADGSSVTFTLRKGVKFHDGSDFNADVVKWNFDLEIPTGKPSNIDWASVDVIDDYTVRVNLKKWTNSTLSNFSFEGGNYIISKKSFDENGIEWARFHMVGTGPFKQTDYVRDVQVVYEKYDDYWNEGRPYLDSIIYKTIADPMTQVAALKSGELDGMASGADKNLKDLVDAGLVAVTGTLGVGGYFPDSENPNSPLSNEKVREALEYAIDKNAIANAFSYGFWNAAYQYAPPSSAAYDDSLLKRTFDLTKARQLLDEAGWGEGFEINLLATNDEPAKSVSQALQSQWAEIGVTANIQILESAKFEEYGRTGWSGLLYAAPTGPSNWHTTIQGVFDPNDNQYVSVEKPQEYINLWNAAATSIEYDPAKEKAVVKYIHDHVMCIPVWNVVRAWVVQPYVKDGHFLEMASGFFWRADTIWLDK